MEERKIEITQAMKDRMRELGSRYPDFKSALIPSLWIVQKEYGYISENAMIEIAKVFGVPPAHVQSVQSFYTMLFDKPVGKHLIQVCRSVSCMLRGSDELLDEIKNYLSIDIEGTTSDGVFTLLTVECLGACGGAPVIQFDYEYFENMTWEKAKNVIDRIRGGENPQAILASE